MKILNVLFIISTIVCSSQAQHIERYGVDSCGLDSNFRLSIAESSYFQSVLKIPKDSIDFSNMRSLFVDKSYNYRFVSKADFFNQVNKIRPIFMPSISYLIFTEDERKAINIDVVFYAGHNNRIVDDKEHKKMYEHILQHIKGQSSVYRKGVVK
jgi:hypothetical protein